MRNLWSCVLGVRMKVIPEKTIITKFQYSRSKVLKLIRRSHNNYFQLVEILLNSFIMSSSTQL